jgi:hypothetical protein
MCFQFQPNAHDQGFPDFDALDFGIGELLLIRAVRRKPTTASRFPAPA